MKSVDESGRRTDLSKEYEGLPRDRKVLREDVFIDVYRYEDGDLSWSGSSNGHEAENAFSYKLLLEAFTQDLNREGPRGF